MSQDVEWKFDVSWGKDGFNGFDLSKLGFGTVTYSEPPLVRKPIGLGQYKAEGSITLEKGAFDSLLKMLPKIKPIYRRIEKGSVIHFEHWKSYRRTILQILSEVNLANQSEILIKGWPYEMHKSIITSNTIDVPMSVLCGPRYERKMKMALAKLVKNGRVKRIKLGARAYYGLKKYPEIIQAKSLLEKTWSDREAYERA